ncbi:restriction endonuclease [Qipengyuania sp. GH25]|uniref:site-specific DNA-methyltransferase (adenine-specific) n=1 Tax=Qipengyuania pacifica TaxID=2860199 RepID=A0ABS7JCW5_9SPHN|nr:restriction endonuclease [Qipengyuania aerophila]MBX7487873.1 restriction endonuclease [Qipengyuania aerophila]
MSSPVPFERKLLSAAEKRLETFVGAEGEGSPAERRLQALEAVSSRLGGYALKGYHSLFSINTIEPFCKLDRVAEEILDLIGETGIPAPLALSALARERLATQDQRKAGAHYTDFRLASYVGRKAAQLNSARRPIVDAACGSGILLVASALETCGSDRKEMGTFLAEGVVAGDVSQVAQRGARLALSSLTADLGAIESLTSRWYVGDSLMRPVDEWFDGVRDGFGAVVGNPPWEKVKIHRHEEALSRGHQGHYGGVPDQESLFDLADLRAAKKDYAKMLSSVHDLDGEVDLFAAFTRLMAELAKDGSMVALLPAGLIRSKGTASLRTEIFETFDEVEVTIFDNRPRFFSIDTRFKFLAVSGRHGGTQVNTSKIILGHGTCPENECVLEGVTSISKSSLESVRPDLSLPEVGSPAEWRLFQKMSRRGQAWSSREDPWYPEFSREIDMTRERSRFLDLPAKDSLPLVEGRMVHQFRFGAKTYVEGSGRRAIWQPNPIGGAVIEPQFYVRADDVPSSASARTGQPRASFCDIAGQTNERSMMAAVVPAGVVCGNKVPTVVFPNALGQNNLHLWCALVNSLAFDWMLRRVLTTTVNYFLLQSVPLPPVRPGELPARRIIESAKRIADVDVSGRTDAAEIIAAERLAIDLLCFRAYGLGGDEIATIMADFPSLDRSQPPIPGERRSTVTRDYILSAVPGSIRSQSTERLTLAQAQGAIAYVPSQINTEEAAPYAGSSANHRGK